MLIYVLKVEIKEIFPRLNLIWNSNERSDVLYDNRTNLGAMTKNKWVHYIALYCMNIATLTILKKFFLLLIKNKRF